MKHILCVIYIIKLLASFAYAEKITIPDIRANPDYFTTRLEYSGTVSLALAQEFGINRLHIGGLIELRNESRFNSKLLPNHNWRGNLLAEFNLFSMKRESHSFMLLLGTGHESAHATMGIEEPTDEPYDMIYDGTYRTYILNSIFVSPWHRWRKGKLSVEFKGALNFYIFSKNTPELTGDVLANGTGTSLGSTLEYWLSAPRKIYISMFERYIFQSEQKARGLLYKTGSPNPERVTSNVIQNVSTFKIKAGYVRRIEFIGQTVEVYMGYLVGNIYGYADSREKRNRLSVGIGFGKKF